MLEATTNQFKFNLEGISNQERIFIETNSSMFKTVNPFTSPVEKAKMDKNVENEILKTIENAKDSIIQNHRQLKKESS
jgi:hypothetical protein